MLSKKIMVPIFAVAVGGATFFGVTQFANAQGNGYSTLVQMIAQKFGLQQSQVQSVFDQYRQQQQTNRQDKLKTKLGSLVSQGKLTSNQEQALLAELAKIKSEYGPRQFKQRQTALTTWAKSQGINLATLFPNGGMLLGHRWTHTVTSTP